MITYGQLFDAVEKNGYRQLFRHLIHVNTAGEVDSACAVGQGLLNLGFTPGQARSIQGRYVSAPYKNDYMSEYKNKRLTTVFRYIETRNDLAKMSLADIAAEGRKVYFDILDEDTGL